MAKERKEMPKEDLWNVEALYPSYADWEKQVSEFEKKHLQGKFSEIKRFQGVLGKNPENVSNLLDVLFRLDREITKLYTYAHLRHDEDVAEDTYKKGYIRVTTIAYELKEACSWVEPEILQLPEKEFQELLKNPKLEPYHIFLNKLFRLKPHTLSSREEELLAMAGQALEVSSRTFSAMDNADMQFPKVENEKGEQLDLSHALYNLYLRSQDRTLRKNTFIQLHRTYSKWENTLCELISGQAQTHAFEAKARNYPSSLEAALFPNQIDPSVYTSLIQTVRANIGSLHKYVAVRKELLGVPEIHIYDLHVPIVGSVDMGMSYEDAEKLVVESIKVLGSDYQNDLKKGLLEQRWVDRYENARKRSGAYSSGCYDSMPYILMNYNGSFNDVMTLTHEAGHSMHSLLSNRNQPYAYCRYPIFVAEVASTFHEQLLFEHLMETVQDPKKRCSLINQKIDGIRATFFRQTMFAEFELKIHQLVEQKMPITPLLLKTEYRKLNVDYFGPDMNVDEETDIEWARIPHFYYNFYVYQYATGISAAYALSQKVKKGGEKNRKDYLKFLSSGSSEFPLDLLKKAGVDMSTSKPTEMLVQYFDHLVSELKKTIKTI